MLMPLLSAKPPAVSAEEFIVVPWLCASITQTLMFSCRAQPGVFVESHRE